MRADPDPAADRAEAGHAVETRADADTRAADSRTMEAAVGRHCVEAAVESRRAVEAAVEPRGRGPMETAAVETAAVEAAAATVEAATTAGEGGRRSGDQRQPEHSRQKPLHDKTSYCQMTDPDVRLPVSSLAHVSHRALELGTNS
jgi:hypothetical protein